MSAVKGDADKIDSSLTEPTVDYARPRPRADRPSPVAAMVLCLPGMICWCVLLGIFLVPPWMRQNFRFLKTLPAPSLWVCWLTAIIFALISLAAYWRRPKPWYVCINLVVNITGLLFTSGVAVLLL